MISARFHSGLKGGTDRNFTCTIGNLKSDDSTPPPPPPKRMIMIMIATNIMMTIDDDDDDDLTPFIKRKNTEI